MESRYYQAGSERASRVHELFSTIARRYDLINDVQSFFLHRLWKQRLLRSARVQAGDQALDICCGTGDVTVGLAKAGARAVGLDFCWPMMAVAMGKVTSKLPMAFVQGDAQVLPFGDGRFDVVTISYGLRNLSDWRRGLAEIYRVLKPTGRLLILDFALPRQGLWRRIYIAYLRGALPLFGFIFCGDAQAYAYILESLLHYPEPERIAEGLRETGFNSIEIIRLLGGIMTIHIAQ